MAEWPFSETGTGRLRQALARKVPPGPQLLVLQPPSVVGGPPQGPQPLFTRKMRAQAGQLLPVSHGALLRVQAEGPGVGTGAHRAGWARLAPESPRELWSWGRPRQAAREAHLQNGADTHGKARGREQAPRARPRSRGPAAPAPWPWRPGCPALCRGPAAEPLARPQAGQAAATPRQFRGSQEGLPCK